ncbi:Nucleoid occlusion protein [Roseivivax jejudonensis]|uniref:Nucleoid occlusion protein n=1 Tax=Roseivivax jejudonensis TaxID=1529041 RepID=A0A1X6ZWR1_9RHOB|nr:plasmid partitioning protein RepB [Roseivivax jejudonensis]SLN63351.1 Nucleoid occlusion protein [Roseivivax jejudonensis]
MARKNVFGDALRGAMKESDRGAAPSPAPRAAETPPAPAPAAEAGAGKRTAPNVRYFSQSFEEQMKRSLQDIDPARIDMSRFSDRIDPGEDLSELKESIRRNGQQVPVLVRRKADDRFEVIYGRRRILACRALERPVRGMVVELDDEDALIAQGLENAARLETSYIERALFVKQILDAGFTAVLVEKAIGVEETQVYRMRGIARDIPAEVIAAVGAAHGVGRRPWEELRKILTAEGAPKATKVVKTVRTDLSSGDRLKALIADLKSAGKPARTQPRGEREIAGGKLRARRAGKALTVRPGDGVPEAFLDHLETALPDLLQEWEQKNGA